MKNKNFIIKLEIYPFDIMCSFGQTNDELKKSLARFGMAYNDKMNLTGIGRFFMYPDTNQSLIRLSCIPRNVLEYGTLSHEIFHSVTHIMGTIGVKFKLGCSDESYAYLIGFVTREIYNELW